LFGNRNVVAIALTVLSVMRCAAHAQPDQPRLSFHETYVEDVFASAQLPLDDPRSVFEYVLKSIGGQAKVYPTENYYYFRFVQNGLSYAGNIRLDVIDRDMGRLHFAYFEDFAPWRKRPAITHVVFDQSDGVTVEKLRPLLYRVTYRDTQVRFELNDLSAAVPPPTAMGPDETYIGPIFDDSAIRFFLIYNKKLKVFHYILDETVKIADELTPDRDSEKILIGKRTGFAFYQDYRLNRKILIGIFDANILANNYFDGPADQLPDNFIEGETLRRAILDLNPGLSGKINRFGGMLDGSSRYLIAPYLRYRDTEELLRFDRCATKKRTSSNYYECFVVAQNAASSTILKPETGKKVGNPRTFRGRRFRQ